jgi:hypothetical protein
MPIRREWRHLYRGPEWTAIRKRILARAGNKCEQCGKPNGAVIFTYTWQTWKLGPGLYCHKLYHMVWIKEASKVWRDQAMCPVPANCWPSKGLPRRITAQIGVAHLDGNPANRADTNLRALCTWCHLHHDMPAHQIARQTRKDRTRAMLA